MKETFEVLKETKIFEYTVNVAVSVLVAYIIIWLIKILLTQLFKYTEFIEEKKKETLMAVVKNTSNYVILAVFLISLFKQFVDLKDLLVAGGVLGIVIGFGAQSLIRDFLYGFFFLFESQFKKGDFVTINDMNESGTVEDLGFRALKVRLTNGKLLTISNGEIKKIVNANIEKRRIFESIVFSYRENPKKLKEYLQELCDRMNDLYGDRLYRDEETNELIEPFTLYGLGTIADTSNGWNYRVCATVKEEEYIEVVQTFKQIIAEEIFERNLKLAEQQLFYQTRANVK